MNGKYLDEDENGFVFRSERDAEVYMESLKSIHGSVQDVINSSAINELAQKNMDFLSLEMALRMEIYNSEATKLVSNKEAFKRAFECMDFLLGDKSTQGLKGQKIYDEVLKIHYDYNDAEVNRLTGFL